jgi:hypothetical protein
VSDGTKEAFLAGWQAAEDWRRLPIAAPQEVEKAFQEWLREVSGD